MSPRLAAALRELNEAVEAEVDEALAHERAGTEKPRDELARRRGIEALKKYGMLPTNFKAVKR